MAIAGLLLGAVISIVPPPAEKWEEIQPHLERIRCTCYVPTGNKTASGVYPYEGIIASNREHLGDMAALYTLEGEYIGTFECRDTGGAASLRNGTSIDVFRDDLARAYEWVGAYGDYVLIQWIKAEG